MEDITASPNLTLDGFSSTNMTEMRHNETKINVVSNDGNNFTHINPKTPTQLLSGFIEFRIAITIYKTSPFIFAVLGTFGNTLSFLVCRQPCMRKSSSCFYMATLAVADLMACWWTLTALLWRYFLPVDVTDASCQVILFAESFSIKLSVWLVVSMTIEKFVAVYFPFKAQFLCTLKSARIAVACLCTLLVLVNLHIFWTIVALGDRCVIDAPKYAQFYKVYVWVDSCFSSYIPLILLYIFNFLIVSMLRRASKKKQELVQAKRRGGDDNVKHVTRMLVSASMFFLATMTPISVFHVSHPYWLDMRNLHMYAVAALVQDIFRCLVQANHSLNFVIYCVSTKRFRQELVNVCGACLPRCRQSGCHRKTKEGSQFDLSMSNGTSASQVSM